jgi:hypothetical protein
MIISKKDKVFPGVCWTTSCFDSCSSEVTIEAPEDHPIGFMKQRLVHSIKRTFKICSKLPDHKIRFIT